MGFNHQEPPLYISPGLSNESSFTVSIVRQVKLRDGAGGAGIVIIDLSLRSRKNSLSDTDNITRSIQRKMSIYVNFFLIIIS